MEFTALPLNQGRSEELKVLQDGAALANPEWVNK